MKHQTGKEKIMGAALHLFGEQGYHKTSVDQIAKVAVVSKGLTYNYFRSKEELLLAIINRATDEMFDVVFSAQVMEHVKDLSKWISELKRIEAEIEQGLLELEKVIQ